jgi:hypothetical protein
MFKDLNDTVWKILALELFHLVCVTGKPFRSRKLADTLLYVSTLRLILSMRVPADIFFFLNKAMAVTVHGCRKLKLDVIYSRSSQRQ